MTAPSPPNSPGAARLPHAPNRTARALELLAVFVGLPVGLRIGLIPAGRLLVLGIMTAVGLAALLVDPSFERRWLWSVEGLRGALKGIFLRAGAAALVIATLVLWLAPSQFLAPASSHPALLATRLLLYALLSAWPQEVLYRVLFFHRYAVLFPGRGALVLASGVAFALLHVVYPNAVAPLLSLPAGLLLARTYHRTRSMGPVWLEHTLYGVLLFMLGLGKYFSGGRWW
jgi:hypothetical protein